MTGDYDEATEASTAAGASAAATGAITAAVSTNDARRPSATTASAPEHG
jgi:hypothetical protein